MPTLEAVAEAHARRQKSLSRRTASRLAKLWASVDRGRLAGSWRELIPAAVATLATAQATAAASATIYVDDALETQAVSPAGEGRIISAAFAGTASDGRDLADLLYQPAIRSLLTIQRGGTPARAMAAGLMSLDVISRTQLADAGRAAEAVAIAARPQVAGYVRMLSLPSCSRCVILAGRRYRWNQGFLRHPRCDCRHIPVAENAAGDLRTDPRTYFDSLSTGEQDRAFTRAGAEAIRSGADINQVVNARRGMQTATVFGRRVQITTEGTTTRGHAGRILGARGDSRKRAATDRYTSARRVRLMPEEIIREANGDREEAIRLLRLHGYIR